ncbi:type I pullulanase [Floricoccus penangensis]|uniref:Type I pullulanase n=1 Tax=Floricoccus penangensis TaxID=1859475 RepID=A0A9Q5NZF2_9LACT|nr:type I pullulanase [Floricoccus penangensis]OFI45704.1 type I pullulanase [Floricoccus penangensis]
MANKLTKALIDKINQINLHFESSIEDWDLDNLDIKLTDEEGSFYQIRNLKTYKRDKERLTLVTARLDLEKNYKIIFAGTETPVYFGAVVRTDEFDTIFAYYGQLGALYSPQATNFKLWAPTASKVELIVFKNNQEEAPQLGTFTMNREENGVYSCLINGNQNGLSYQYRVTFRDGTVNYTGDPYAKAVVVNGKRSVVLNPDEVKLKNFKRMPKFTNPMDAIIYELHTRDLSIAADSGIKNKGKFLGLIEEGTLNSKGKPTGLDYIKSLGVSHIQILPMFDYGSVDESKPDIPQFNWGYDPENYDSPEGSYSTDANNPQTRIIEMKQMIDGLHKQGLRVIMDVVYNHVFNAAKHAFHLTVPGYFFRYARSGQLSNGTGCDNDTASERAMMRKYMIDSLTYWAENFKLDGFRFDLMGIHDVETMNEIRAAIDEIDPSIIILGEGWDLNTALSEDKKAIQKNAVEMPRIAHFNDSIRDTAKGSVFFDDDPGFINGASRQEKLLLKNIMGGQDLDSKTYNFSGPDQVVQYLEAHDNYTLYDKLLLTNPDDDAETRRLRHLLGTSIPLLSQGIPFFHAGQEFMRTKDGVENSYKSPDSINEFDWNRPYEYAENVEFFRSLIKLRKSEPLFRLTTFDQINEHIHALQTKKKLIAYELEDDKVSYIVVLNALEKENKLEDTELKDYQMILSSHGKQDNSGIFPPISVTIMKKEK